MIRNEIMDALRAANITSYIRTRFGSVKISGKAASEQYHFPSWVIERYEASNVARRTGGAANSKKLYPLAALVEIEQCGKIEADIINYDIRQHNI